MSSTIDTSLAPLVGLLALVIAIALYVWMSLALAAMFRKMGEEAWKGWVPFLNQATVLSWGGFNPWLVLLVLVPGVGAIAVLVLLVISAHRINPGFGYGSGMTVLAALLFVVWASILGFGPSPWRGARHSAAPPIPPRPPLPPTTAAYAASAAAAAGGFPAGAQGVPAFPPPPAAFPVAASSFPVAPVADPPAAQASPAPPAAPASWAPPPPPAMSPPAAATPDPDVESWPSEIDDVSAVSPSPFPPSAAAPTAARQAQQAASGGTGLDGLISFVPGRRSADAGDDGLAGGSAQPPASPVTRLPVTTPIDTPVSARAAEPVDADAFPELSGEVSAVVGSPVAGAPISARSSVSAQQREKEPDEPAVPAHTHADAPADIDEDDVDETVMVRRKKVTWRLVPASGPSIALTSEVVLLGRRPSPDVSFPRAQLVTVPDEARTVSKTHARLELRGERWLVTDLGSTNGVLLRTLMGEEIEIEPGTEIDPGERFFLGDEEFHLQHD
jgi:hypothetical protein